MTERTTAMDSRATELVDAFAGSRWWEALQELGCLAYLDHHADVETLEKVIPLLHDPKSDVRLWAVHTLGCDRCKPGENPLDVEPMLIERALHDESLRVRRQAVVSLAYLRPPDPRSAALFARILEGETDRKLVLHATAGLRKARAVGVEPRTETRARETGER